MRLRVRAKVQGIGRTPRAFECDKGDYRVGVVTDDTQKLVELWADCVVADYARYLPTIEQPATGPLEFRFSSPPETKFLIATLQYLEALGSFWAGVWRVGWDEAAHEWIPETDEEQDRLSVMSIATSFNYPETPADFSAETIARLLLKRSELEYLVLPMSFYREGLRDFRSHRYTSAFFNYYFFLEGLYGNGKTKNLHVLRAFNQSTQLQVAADRAFATLDAPELQKRRTELNALAASVGSSYSRESLFDFIVRVRGELHHYSIDSSRPKGHPLNQENFSSIAFLLSAICLNLIVELANCVPLQRSKDRSANA